jgi:S1-C subfamily serine protease
MSITDLSSLASFSDAIADLIAKASAGVVAVKGAAYRNSSGICLGSDLIACSNHVLKRDENVEILANDEREFQAMVVGRMPGIDVAVLKTEGQAPAALAAADLSALKPGALVAAVGWTTDVGPSASLGILGAIGGPRRMWRGGGLDHFLRLDINLYPSQSGGAVVDSEGRLIGLATPALSRHAAIAVPIDTIQNAANELRSAGRIRHGYIGVGAQEVPIPPPLREKVHTPIQSGLMLLSVEPDSPAGRAGLQLGDILVLLNGKPTGDIFELQELLGGTSVGKSVEATLIRGGEPVQVAILVGERPARRGHPAGQSREKEGR